MRRLDTIFGILRNICDPEDVDYATQDCVRNSKSMQKAKDNLNETLRRCAMHSNTIRYGSKKKVGM